MHIHHVFFYTTPDADSAALRAGIETLTQIEVIRQSHIGVPGPTDRPVIERGYTFSWLAIFDTSDAEAIYQTHPVHLAFIKDYGHLWSRVVVYDSI